MVKDKKPAVNRVEECRFCRFYIKPQDATNLPPGTGLCRRNPPTLMHCVTEKFDTSFPCVNDGEWCGEWDGN